MKTSHKIFSIITLFLLLTMAFATPVLAFDGRGGDKVVINADEVVNDDLYVTANDFVLDGTVKGDVVVFASTITINGTVEGDLIAAGQSIVINGTVKDSARIAGAVLQITDKASIGSDLVSAGASLESQKGSAIARDLVFAGGQALLAGNVARNALLAAGSLELRGEFDGNVTAEVGDAGSAGGPPPTMYIPQSSVTAPSVAPGLTIAKSAKIKGNFEYTQSKDITIPSGAVDGKVTRKEPTPQTVRTQPTMVEKVSTWSLDLLRTIVALFLFGLLLGWLAPAFMNTLMEKLQAKPLANLGWGIVAYAAFFFTILIVVVVMIIGGVIFGSLTLNNISGTIVWLGIAAIFELIVGFVLVTSFLTKILVGWLSGKWIINRFNPGLAENKVWPLLLGVFIVALLIALPFVGWLFGLIVMFLGLGALWLWGRDLWQVRGVA